MHLCLLAGLLQRQGPHHPRISRHLCGIMPAMLRNGLENGLSPWGGKTSLWNSLTSSLEVKLLTILGEEDGCEESWLVPLTGILTTSHVSPGSHSILAHTYYSRLGSLSSQMKSDYYCPFSVLYNFGKGFTMRCSCILRRDNLKACLYPLFFVYVYYWKFKSQIL